MSNTDDYYFGVLSLKEKAGCVLRCFSEGKTVEQVTALCGDDGRDRTVIDTYIVLFNELGLIEHVAPVSDTFHITDIGRYAIKMLEGADIMSKTLDSAPDRNEGRALP